MIFANYHTHTTFCDGRDTPEQLVQEAIRLGCPALGFTGHSYAFYDAACMPKENIRPYQAEIRRLQSAYSGQIQILLGIEQEYYRLVGDLYEKTHCRVIAHFDLIEKFNEAGELFDRTHPRYRAAALAALNRLKSAPVLFEINTGAIARGYRTSPYPDPFLLRAMQDAGVKLMLNSDCHDRRFLLCGFDQYAHLVPPESFSPDYLLNA